MPTRLERILTLLGSLANGGCTDVASIAKKLDVSRRTVFRDLETLRKAGVKIRFDRPHKAYHVDQDNGTASLSRNEELGRPTRKKLRTPRSSDLAELIRLIYVNAIPQTLAQRREAVRAADSLLSVLREDPQRSIQDLLSSVSLDNFEPATKRTREVFDTLAKAIANGQTVSLGFRQSSHASYKLREVFPLRMRLNGGYWVLEGLITEDHRSLRIRLDKIFTADALEEPSKAKLTDVRIDWCNVDIEVL